ncbi:gamma-glutamyltransferase [Rhodococcus sp. BP-252]|nr:gamma-glutamyltransferase [Rhodococcus sp. BP-320]MBY6417612.1 gamma-glutamyltransferase [Rhodococcus sp. BP-321]MBY6423464.1 gamma-glutamyltransferase [Rhodococcus sp. BP-324]MBY6427636.1 gamma-glutamyltransferase [Rhodococcus sp. BP-323]MBY6432800.1 gamma-glutamyltransferase [Rhodococcus sp. BP-322]MBY6441584.1 gamma-glutamyltransferase [Rhodococcus sp. BP-319]MBY6446594.1 gamma-glutamyltransferase [Rhodococcus sp. BP-318]MBY6451393.1 gamma-glutamyltransferase [Rhodococcus sp. BP-315]M
MLAPRPTLTGSRHAVSAGHYLAASAGFAVLEAGGNAVDAGVAAGIALSVVHADEVNFAGVAPIMIRTSDGTVVTIDGLGHWPTSAPVDLMTRLAEGKYADGIGLTVVPGAPSSWLTALRDFGTMTFAQVSESAISLALEGFAVFPFLADEISKHQQDYAKYPSSAAIYLPAGVPPAVGDRFVQTELAWTIQHMVDAEDAVSGDRIAGIEAARNAFYVGEIADRVVAFHEANGSYLSRTDLRQYRSRYEDPVQVRWRDFTIYTCGPWSQGPVLGQALRMLELLGLGDAAHNSVEYVHVVTEVLKLAFADREKYYGDPLFVDVPTAWLLSDEYLRTRIATIDGSRSSGGLAPEVVSGHVPECATGTRTTLPPDTSYVSVIDRWGNSFSATPSDASWPGPVVPGTGVVVSVRGIQSRPDAAHPAGMAPGKRPRLTPNPAMAVRDDGSVFSFGCPGGDMQVQAMLQVFLNAFHFGMDIQDAITSPRFSTWSFPNSFAPFEYLPNRVALEAERFPDGVLTGLEKLGHEVEQWPAFTRQAAAVEVVFDDKSSGFIRAGADPRQPAYAMVR